MEIADKNIIVTQKWLKDICFSEAEIKEFTKYFPNGGMAIDVLNKYMDLSDLRFFKWVLTMLPSSPFTKGTNATYLINELIRHECYDTLTELLSKLPFNEKPKTVNNVNERVFYDGDVHVKGDANPKTVDVKGHFKIDGDLNIKNGDLGAKQVSANTVNLSNNTKIHAQVDAKVVNLKIFCTISGDVKANTVNLDQSLIFGNVDANEIINNSGNIIGNVNAAKIKIIKGGRIEGNIEADEIINDGGIITGDVNTIKIQNINGGRVEGKITYK